MSIHPLVHIHTSTYSSPEMVEGRLVPTRGFPPPVKTRAHVIGDIVIFRRPQQEVPRSLLTRCVHEVPIVNTMSSSTSRITAMTSNILRARHSNNLGCDAHFSLNDCTRSTNHNKCSQNYRNINYTLYAGHRGKQLYRSQP